MLKDRRIVTRLTPATSVHLFCGLKAGSPPKDITMAHLMVDITRLSAGLSGNSRTQKA